ncbi:hypothetical protein BDY21DRAFT_400216 [Lineolata rhizophorae]|uniref:Uncharacterized protein n=1 Tax=Lineolata rhizophorae TaxID=578093 RepID=A0A6A6NS72_9PEZI|nr:hypothetical protein BDY21DRAFT_400216 [Lineolata rhizophorae]
MCTAGWGRARAPGRCGERRASTPTLMPAAAFARRGKQRDEPATGNQPFVFPHPGPAAMASRQTRPARASRRGSGAPACTHGLSRGRPQLGRVVVPVRGAETRGGGSRGAKNAPLRGHTLGFCGEARMLLAAAGERASPGRCSRPRGEGEFLGFSRRACRCACRFGPSPAGNKKKKNPSVPR